MQAPTIAIPIPQSPCRMFPFTAIDDVIIEIISSVIESGALDERAKLSIATAIRRYYNVDAESCADTQMTDADSVARDWYDDIADALVDVIAGSCNIAPITEFLASCGDVFLVRLFAVASEQIEMTLGVDSGAMNEGMLEGVGAIREHIAMNAQLAGFALSPSCAPEAYN